MHVPSRPAPHWILRNLGSHFPLFVAALLMAGCSTRPATEPGRVLRVMTYNIHHGEGVDGRLDLERIAALINEQQPDLVALQEVDRGVARTQGRDLPAELGRLTGLKPLFSRNITYQGGEYGNAILSRYPVLQSTNRHYRMLREGEQRGLLQATVQTPAGEMVFFATHLDFRPDPEERLSNVEEIKAAAGTQNGRPVIVAGDFNDHPGGAVHESMKTRFRDVWEDAGSGTGFTFSSTQRRSRIDYIYLLAGSDWRAIRAEVLSSPASDHLPLLVEFRRQP